MSKHLSNYRYMNAILSVPFQYILFNSFVWCVSSYAHLESIMYTSCIQVMHFYVWCISPYRHIDNLTPTRQNSNLSYPRHLTHLTPQPKEGGGKWKYWKQESSFTGKRSSRFWSNKYCWKDVVMRSADDNHQKQFYSVRPRKIASVFDVDEEQLRNMMMVKSDLEPLFDKLNSH